MPGLNLSFAAAGFLGIYHIGAAEAFICYGDKLLGSLRSCTGASARAMVAALIVTAPDKLQKWIDGGFTDSLPVLPVGRTITISPFAGVQDVCPLHRGHFNRSLRLANMSIMLSVDNLKRLHQSVPTTPSCMQLFCEEGFMDTVRLLKREAWMS